MERGGLTFCPPSLNSGACSETLFLNELSTAILWPLLPVQRDVPMAANSLGGGKYFYVGASCQSVGLCVCVCVYAGPLDLGSKVDRLGGARQRGAHGIFFGFFYHPLVAGAPHCAQWPYAARSTTVPPPKKSTTGQMELHTSAHTMWYNISVRKATSLRCGSFSHENELMLRPSTIYICIKADAFIQSDLQ